MATTIDNGVSQSLLDSMNPNKATSKTTAEEAQDRFMTLLITQMKNQDPLNPLDNAQVTSQLAQLSTVTGIDKLNTTLETLKGSYQASQTLQAASMIGHGVLTPGSGTDLAEGMALMGVELTQPVDKLVVTILDSNGKEVRTLDMGSQDPGTVAVPWDGKTNDGADAEAGHYTFKITATLGSETMPATALQFGMVTSVSTNAQGVKLNVPGQGEVDFADVRQIL
ncbi:flagellar hook assembly protein FlgD [Noviherbaspirillum cavernae]|uniref:Basal-body rod modification protein FlgD n=1 Tax=Noviherbaspirillum cavernae TaxID=2320862 RepID=A0A418X0D9_9BURK|nr:flagellar hook assembly protein FlgD [Noviherbaspirillum cavernae]RJG05936.1 flagellar hook assembly protein FlgD [Noviherbaspirillum cavernae]